MATTTQGTKRLPLGSIVWREPSRPIDPRHVKELSASIEEVGLLQPIGVVDLGGEKYEGRLGRHRFEAVKALGQPVIDAYVLDLDDVKKEIATVHENLKRLDPGPIDRAKMFRRYADLRKAQDPKILQEAIAKELQVSGPEFSNTVMLLDQEAHIQKLVADGRITPGHVEHVLAPLAKELPVEALVKFAHGIAGKPEAGQPATDIRTAKQDADRLLERHRTEVLHEAAVAAAKKAKGKVILCPFCNYGDRQPEKFFEADNRPVLEHTLPYGDAVHRWYADSGEVYLTGAEKKELDRRKEADASIRRQAAKERKKKGEGGKVLRDYAVFLSRATPEQWAQGLLDASVKAGLFEVRVGDLDTGGYRYGGSEGDLHLSAAKKLAIPSPVFVTRIKADGADLYKSRVQFGAYASLPSRRDNIAERADVAALRKNRADLLAFQRGFGAGQKDDDAGPTELGGFKRGERVKLGPSCEPKGYAGKEGVILAFDAEGKEASAVLDVPWPSKVHTLSTLGKVTKFACSKCGRPARVVVQDGKAARICNGPCGQPEAKCTCEIRGAVQAARAAAGPTPAKTGKAKKTPKGRGK